MSTPGDLASKLTTCIADSLLERSIMCIEDKTLTCRRFVILFFFGYG